MPYTHLLNSSPQGLIVTDNAGQGRGGIISRVYWAKKEWLIDHPVAPETVPDGDEQDLMIADGAWIFDDVNFPYNGLLELELSVKEAGSIKFLEQGESLNAAPVTELEIKFDALNPNMMGWAQKFRNARDLILVVEQKCGLPHIFAPSKCRDFYRDPSGSEGTTGVNKGDERFLKVKFMMDGWAPYLRKPDFPIYTP